jgi:hypothetical protein
MAEDRLREVSFVGALPLHRRFPAARFSKMAPIIAQGSYL